MSIKKPAIPDVRGVADARTREALDALRENVEIITGRRGTKIAKLGGSATLAAVILKVNEIIDWLQT